ncbi:MAG TPA: FtsX-like permease family protein [Vicinamibacterales bacterium]|nr:FtsX-like permease family protein [Vicinamibacterales bacterium]
MEHAVSISLLPARLAGWLLAALGALALVLSALGTYGVLSFLVRSRSKELAIRLAIGASPAQVGFMVIRQSLAWTGVCASVGMGLALVVTQLLTSFLYGVNPRDPFIFGLVAALIGSVACAAAFVPARRASQQDPLVTLRDASSKPIQRGAQ